MPRGVPRHCDRCGHRPGTGKQLTTTEVAGMPKQLCDTCAAAQRANILGLRKRLASV